MHGKSASASCSGGRLSPHFRSQPRVNDAHGLQGDIDGASNPVLISSALAASGRRERSARKILAHRQEGGPAGPVHGRGRRRLLLRLDKKTPLRAKGILLAALGYFVLPVDIIPDFVLGLGFTDDIAVLTAAITAVSAHITAGAPAGRQARRSPTRAEPAALPARRSAVGLQKSNSCRFRGLQVATRDVALAAFRAAARKWRRFPGVNDPFLEGNSPFGNPD